MVDLRFHGFYFHSHLGNVVTEISDIIQLTASNFLSLSAFFVGDMGLLFGQFFLFYPEYMLVFFRHGFFERGILLSSSTSRPPCMYIDVLFRLIGLVSRIQVDSLDFVFNCSLLERSDKGCFTGI
ncbi:hypothetical protein N665_0080s0002 [Sinapis alba]|nr:hypothetical protein N665_0080s0002 [Sinapis alba]